MNLTERHFYTTEEDNKIIDLLTNYQERGQDRQAVLMLLADEFDTSVGSITARFNKLKKERGISTRGGYRRSAQKSTTEVVVSFRDQLSAIADNFDAELAKKDKKIEALKEDVEKWKEKYHDLNSKLRQATKLAKLLVTEEDEK